MIPVQLVRNRCGHFAQYEIDLNTAKQWNELVEESDNGIRNWYPMLNEVEPS